MKKFISILLSFSIAVTVCGFGSGALAERVTPIISRPLFAAAFEDQQYANALGLTAKQVAQLESELYSAADDFRDSCDISKYQIPYNSTTEKALSDILFFGDCEHIQIGNISFSLSYDEHFKKVLFTSYQFTKTEYTAMKAQWQAAAANMIVDLRGDDFTDLEKALILHDRLATTCEYDYTNYLLGDVPPVSYTMYGALVNHIAVCNGYSYAYKYLLEMLGIPCAICQSSSLGHDWNIVWIDGVPYHVDITYDDAVYDIDGRVNHHYFLVSTAFMKAHDHNADDYFDFPTDTRYDNAFWHNSSTAFVPSNGKLYGIDGNANQLCVWDQSLNATVLAEVGGSWRYDRTSYWPGNYARLCVDENGRLFYSTPDKVFEYDPVLQISRLIWKPTLSNYQSIFGLRAANGTLYINISNTPNFTETTKKEQTLSYPYSGVTLSQVTVSKSPDKLAYYLNDPLSLDGLELQCRYSDGNVYTVGPEAVTVVTAQPTGTAGRISVELSYAGLKVSFPITVTTPSVTFSAEALSIEENKVVSYAAAADPSDMKLTYTSGDPLIATVSQSGQIHGKSTGFTTITATGEYAGKTYSAVLRITVGHPLPVSISGTIGGSSSQLPITLQLTDDAGIIKILTVTDGAFTFTDLPSGSYILVVKQSGTYTVRYRVNAVKDSVLVLDTPVRVGDINKDGAPNAADALLVLKAAVAKAKLTEEQKAFADLNNDGAVNAADALIILKIAVGKYIAADKA